MKKIKAGDVFSLKVEGGNRYFQYLGNDNTQLGGNIIAAFSGVHQQELFEIEKINELPIDFYAMTSIPLGVKIQLWDYFCSAPVVQYGRILFRSTEDYGEPEMLTSNDWWVWEPNTVHKHIGPLIDEYRNSYIGVLAAPTNVSDRLKTGKYSYFYPAPVGNGPFTE